MIEQTLWVEKYRPRILDDCVIPDKLKKTLKGFVKKNEIPNIMFTGTQGTGKTTCAKALIRELDAEYIHINCSEASGKAMIEESVIPFASTISIQNPDTPKFILCDECLEENETVRIGTVDDYKDVPLKELSFGQEYPIVSMNMQTGELVNDTGYLCVSKKDTIYKVSFMDGHIIRCNSKHPFVLMDKHGTFYKARLCETNLVGKLCVFFDHAGEKHIVEIRCVEREDVGIVMDVTVRGNHTFVTSGGLVTSNCDYLTPHAQATLRGVIEQFSLTTRFIFTANYPERIIPALKSRCTHFDMSIDKADKPELLMQFYKRCANILQENGVTFEQKPLGIFIAKHFPDFRKIINELQSYSSASGSIDSGILTLATDTIANSLFPLLKDKDFDGCRKWVSENLSSPEDVFTSLYNNLKDCVAPHQQPEIILILAQYQDYATRVANQQLNLMACFVEIMSSLKQ